MIDRNVNKSEVVSKHKMKNESFTIRRYYVIAIY